MNHSVKDRDFKLGEGNFYDRVTLKPCLLKVFCISTLILFLLISSEGSLLEERNSKSHTMSSKLRICYQNLGLGDRVTRKLHDLLNIVNTRSPHILYISETLIDVDAIARIESIGYTVEAMPLTSERIWAAVKDGVEYKRLHEYELVDFPALWIQVGSGKNSYIVCGLYREFTRLDNVQESRKLVNQRERFNRFLDMVQKAISTNKEVILIGDWNLNVQKWIQNGNQIPGWKFQGLTNDLHDKCINHGFVRHVDCVTRIHGKLESTSA